MDEVDKIVLSSLKEIGYVPKDDVMNLKLYPFEELLAMVLRCFREIRPELNVPLSLPPTMSIRYNLCSQFAQICKDLGFKREVGYHTFMYQNVTEIRDVLLFLVEHLPKKNTHEESTSVKDQNATIKQKVSDILKNTKFSDLDSEYSGMCKVPFMSVPLETGTLLPNQKIDCKPPEWREFVAKKLPYIDEQLPDKRCLLPSVIALNSRGLINPNNLKCSKFNMPAIDDSIYQSLTLLSNLPFNLESKMSSLEIKENENIIDETPLESNSDEEPSKEDLTTPELFDQDQEAMNELVQEISSIKIDINSMKIKYREVTKNIEIVTMQLHEKLMGESSLQKSIALLPEFEDNVHKLEAAIEKSQNKITTMSGQWKRHKTLLLTKKTEMQSSVDNLMAEKNELVQKLNDFRLQLVEVTQEIEKRNSVEEKLKKVKMDTSIQRVDFINRILEMIKNIKKQDEQIVTTLNDTKAIQKAINVLSGKVERSYAITEHIIAPNAHDALSLETHTLITTLHKHFNDILDMIDETGKYAREIKDLEDQIRDNSNNIEQALKDVTKDLKRLKTEQTTIINELAKYTALGRESEALETGSELTSTSLEYKNPLNSGESSSVQSNPSITIQADSVTENSDKVIIQSTSDDDENRSSKTPSPTVENIVS